MVFLVIGAELECFSFKTWLSRPDSRSWPLAVQDVYIHPCLKVRISKMRFQNPSMHAMGRALCAGVLAFSAAQAHALSLTVVNSEDVPLEMTVQHRNHCFQTNDPNAANGKTNIIPPKSSQKLGFWHAGDWRGCGSTAGEFVLVFKPSSRIGSTERDKVGFWFDRGQGFGILTSVDPNYFPGKLTTVGPDSTFTTDMESGRVRKVSESGFWDLLCDGSCTGSATKTVSESGSTSKSVTTEQSSAISKSLTVGAEGGGYSASASISSEQKQSLARTMQQSFERGVSSSQFIDFAQYTAEKMKEWNINGIYQWVVDIQLSDASKHSVRSPIFRCVSSTQPPKYHPADPQGVGSCTGSLVVQQTKAQAPSITAQNDMRGAAPASAPNPPAARGFELFWNGKKVNGPDAESYTNDQAKLACSQNRRDGIKIECRYNGAIFYKE